GPPSGKTGTHVLPTGADGAGFDPCPRSIQVGEFEVAISGGVWVAAGGLLLQDLLYQWGVSQFFFNVWQTLGRS
ncbi:MAG: hypothetical protein Q7U52_03510, partial [Hydrogenophaga sp.]|nr:hypothetical protein [Hydrogenophaga sp.]